MLADLDRIAWADLSHAYGSAADVPSLLRALTSADPEERSEALDALYGNIWHQGTVYQATAYAVPFLIEIAAAPSIEERAAVLDLLHVIANGSSYLDVHQHLSFVGATLRAQPDFDAQLATELDWVRCATEAVASGHARYLELLDDRDEEVRRFAVKLLAVCRPAAGEILPRLIERARTADDPALRASILFAVAALDPARGRPLLEDALSSKAAIVRLASALGLSSSGQEPPPSRALDVLAHHLKHLDEVDYALFPFGGDQGADIATALTRAEPADRKRYAAILLERAEAGEAAPLHAVRPMMALAFEGPLENPSLESLDPTQRRVLEFVARRAWERRNGSWYTFVNYVDHLRAYGLEALGEQVTGYATRG